MDAAGPPDDEPRPLDDAGNPVLRDIGAHLKGLFKGGALGEVDCKYIDPTYLVEVGRDLCRGQSYCYSVHLRSQPVWASAGPAAGRCRPQGPGRPLVLGPGLRGTDCAGAGFGWAGAGGRGRCG